MDTKEIILELTEAFDKNDVETIFKHFNDDVEWNMVGNKTMSGKEEIRKMFSEMPEMKMMSSTKDHIIIDVDQAVVDGKVQYTGNDEKLKEMYYCDIYEFESGKIKKMTSYVVEIKN